MEANGSRSFCVAVFGAGRIGRIHIRNIEREPKLKLLWVVEDLVEPTQLFLAELGSKAQVVEVKNCQSLLEDKRVDAVFVCTPSPTHEDIVTRSLIAGKAVFCEKPLALTLEAVEKCYKLAKEKELTLFCAFNRHWDPQNRKIKGMIEDGSLGKVKVIRTVSRDPPGMTSENYIKTSGGVFVDSCIHDLDLVCWLVGEKPSSIYAIGHATDPIYEKHDDVDSCSVTLKFPSGTIGVIEVSREAPTGYYQYVEVLGTESMVHTEHVRQNKIHHFSMKGTLKEPLVSFLERYKESYVDELTHFIDIINGGKEEVTQETVVRANKLALACKESNVKNEVISLKNL